MIYGDSQRTQGSFRKSSRTPFSGIIGSLRFGGDPKRALSSFTGDMGLYKSCTGNYTEFL